MNDTIPVPVEIRLDDSATLLTLRYDSGVRFELTAEYLRVLAPSADVQGHGGVGGQLVTGKRGVTIDAVERVGNYAVRLHFSDGHHNGIYTWKTLLSLGVNREQNWSRYLSRLAAAGAGRG